MQAAPPDRQATSLPARPHWLWPALALALLPCLPLLLRGVPLGHANSGFDADFALSTLHALLVELRQGLFWPHWASADHAGFGSPIFYYYAQLSWLLAAPWALLGMAEDRALVLTVALARLLAFAGALAWLQGWVRERRLAALGAALYVLGPYIATNLAMQRFAYAECVALAWIPLAFIAIDRPWPLAPKLLLGSTGYALLALTHLPSTLITAAVTLVYAAALQGWAGLLRSLAAGLLGAALAAFTLAPALLLQGWNAAEWWLPDWLTIGVHALFSPHSLAFMRRFWDVGSRLVIYAAWLASLLPLLLWRWDRDRAGVGLRLTLLLLLVVMVWPLALMLDALPAIRHVEFPWRGLGVASLLAAAVAVLAVRRQPQLRGPLLGAALALSLAQALLPMADQMLPHRAWLSFRWLLPQFAADSAARQAALAAAAADRPEYLTRWANAAGWPPGRSPDPADILRGVASREGLAAYGQPAVVEGSADLSLRREAGGFTVNGRVESLHAVLRLPHFYWPAFAASAGRLDPDPETGLMLLDIARGPVAISILVAPTRVEQAGYAVSAVAAGGWLALAALALHGRRRAAAPGRRLPAH